jgi:hypothetical protein
LATSDGKDQARLIRCNHCRYLACDYKFHYAIGVVIYLCPNCEMDENFLLSLSVAQEISMFEGVMSENFSVTVRRAWMRILRDGEWKDEGNVPVE